MVLDTWIECDDRFAGLRSRRCRHYACKNRAAVSAKSPEAAALAAFTSFVRLSRNGKFKVRHIVVLDPETVRMRSYRIVMRDGRPFVRETLGYGSTSKPGEIAVPDKPARAYDEATELAREWQGVRDRLDAARYAACAAQAQKKEGRQCR